MEGIDPRLRDTAPPHYDQNQRPSANYNGVTSQPTVFDAPPPPPPSSTTSSGQAQHQQYYGMPTPRSYSSGPHQDAEGSPYEAHGPQPLSDPNDLKRPRACEACRQLKVRCELDDNSPSGSCRRCQKANRQCVVTAPSRKRQKKTDSRVAELEKKIDALTATLHARRAPGPTDSPVDPAIAQAQMAELEHQRGQLYNQTSWPEGQTDSNTNRESNSLPSPSPADHAIGSKRKFTQEAQVPAYNEPPVSGEQPLRRTEMPDPPKSACLFSEQPSASKEAPNNSYIDVIDRQIIDAQTAHRIFHRYNTEMQCLPIMVFPPATKAEDIRRSKPVLFLAILSVASNTIRPDLQADFVSEIMQVLADRVICRGEKTLELVQSLQVITIFYQPPARYEELNFNVLIHVAVVMAIDIGMGKRSRAGRGSHWREQVGKTSSVEIDAAETRRAWLGLYFMCGNAAMALRRPLLVRWSAYMDESLEVLAKAPDALPSDKWLAHAVRGQHIVEEVGYQFSMDDPPSDVSITQPKIQYQIKTFEKQLDEWRRNSTKDMPQDLLKHNEAIIDLYIHEIAMHHSHNIDDFRPPYGMNDDEEDQPDYITPAHIDSLTICLDSIHKAFDAFIKMPTTAIRSLPTLLFVRNSYAAVALIKMYTAVSAKGSKFGSVFKPKDLRVEYYLDALSDSMKRAGEGGKCRVAMKFNFILGMLRNWQAKRTPGVLTQKDKNMLTCKSLDETWQKQELGQNPQDPKTASWNTTAVGVNANSKPTTMDTTPQRSGLQMLSEAAMGNNNISTTSNPSDPAALAATAPTSSTAPWDAQIAAYAHMHPPQQHQNQQQQQRPTSTAAVADTFTNQAYMQGIENFAFTAEELGALGSMMDDPGWFSFGLESGGWAM